MLTGVVLETVLVLCFSQLIGEVQIMVYNLVRDWGGTRYMEGVVQVEQVYELEREGCMRDICSLFWWLGSRIYLSDTSLC